MPTSPNWFPLESNPVVMNKYLASLGVDTTVVSFHDVFGLDEDLLSMLPQPVLALLLVFPVTDATEQEAITSLQKQEESGATSIFGDAASPIYFMKQTIRNACGTVGILHALLNAEPSIVRPSFKQQSFIDQFSHQIINLTPLERAELMEKSEELHSAQETAASDGVTENASIDEDVDLHFVCFTKGPRGTVLEFDGRQSGPILRGDVTSPEVAPETASLELACAKAIKERMLMNPESMRFTITALCGAPSDNDES